MEQLKMHSLDKIAENVEKIASLFPNCITESADEHGGLQRSIDFDMLKQELSDYVVEGLQERYQFTWPDKKKAMLAANAPINKTLRPCREESVDFDNTENLYIEGDNLEVLKLLQETYLGKVKMIYIDPPYNTGNDFLYDDDFAQDAQAYMANSGQYSEEGNRLVVNTESEGRFHTKWLNMMYPRLKLAKDLLSNDGLILVSIGDRELKDLQAIMDEVFGENKQVCCFVWKSRAKPTNAGNARFRPQKVSEYVLVYTKGNPEEQIYNVISAKERTYPHQDENGRFRITTILTSNRGTFKRETMRFESHGYTPSEDFRWKAGKSTIDRLYESNHMFITDDGIPMEKKYEYEESDPLYPIYTFIDPDISGTAENGKLELGSLLGKNHGFDTVKPVQLLKYMIQTFTGKDDIIMDYFSGSGTTAQAVFEQNSEDVGKRQFVLVQIGEPISENNEAFKAGYKNICEIGKERIRRAGQKIKEENPLTTQDLDIGFRVLKLDSSNMEDIYYTPKEYMDKQISLFVDNVKADRSSEDLLFQVMLDLGTSLSSKIVKKEIAGKEVYDVANGHIMACFDKDVNDDVITAIAKEKPSYFVMRDNSLADDSVAINFDQIFNTYSPNTERKVL